MSPTPRLALDHRCHLGEAPAWDARERRLLFVDILRGHIHWYDPATAQLETAEVGQSVGAVVPREKGGYMLALASGFAAFDRASGQLGPLHPIEANDLPGTRLNDGKCDPAGRFWAGTRSDLPQANGATLHRLDLDGSVTMALTGVGTSNGLDWSDDGRRFYFIDTPTGGVDVFEFDASSGTLGTRQRLIDIARADGVPDGMTLDSEGGIWVALLGGGAIRRYTIEGVLDLQIDFPVSLVTSCAFGGEELDELYVTSAAHRLTQVEPLAGSLFQCETGFRGRPARMYKG